MRIPRVQRRRLWTAGVLIAALAAVAAATGIASATATEGDIVGADSSDAVANSYIVVLKQVNSSDVAGSANRLAARFNGKVDRTYTAALHGFATSMSAAQARRLAAQPDVAYVAQNRVIRLNTTQPSPPSWGLDRIDQRAAALDNSYTYPTLASNVHAYVIDTGIRRTHTDLGGRAVTGVDEITAGGTADDCNGHGTHVAGTIGGTSHGVAKGVQLVAVRVLDCVGNGTTASVVAGVDWVTANAVKPAVANMSLGGDADSTLDTAVANSIASGVTYGVAAGNSNANACDFSPARVSTAITVGATDANDNRASFSNFGSCVHIFAPGVNITSAWNTNNTATRTISGTSMATPHVVGAAALVLAANPSLTPSQVRSNLTSTANWGVVNRGADSPNLLLYTGADPVLAPPANDFDIVASPSTGVTTPGGSVTATVSTPVTVGGSQTITPSASGLPAGASATFSPSTINSGTTFVATFHTSASTPAGTYPVAITATGTDATHAATYTLVVSTNQGAYYGLTPSRILDTRTGNGAPKAPVGTGATISLQVTGRGGVPATGVSAVVLNVTVTGATAASFVTVYPAGVAKPTASSLNLVAGWTGANSVTVAVGTGGKVNLYNNSGSTEIIADVVGFYAADASTVGQFGIGGQYQPVTPERLFDSRTDWNLGKLPGGSWVQVAVDYGTEVNTHIRALVVNVTAVDPSSAGYLTTWNGVNAPPTTSTLNYTTGGIVPNMAVVPVALCCGGLPSIGVYTHANTHVIVDILGFFDDSTLPDGLRFTPQTPVRIADTRTGLGAPNALGQGATAVITAPSAVAPSGTQALALNVTAVSPTAYTYLTVWPNGISGISQPYVSTLNPAPGQIVPNAAYTLIGPTSAFNVYNNAGTTHLVVDVVGTFWNPSIPVGAVASAQLAPLSGKQPWARTGTHPPTAIRTG